MITATARIKNPKAVPALVEDVTLWHSDGGWILQTLVERDHGYVSEERTIEVPAKQAVTLRLGYAIRSKDLEARGRKADDYMLRVTLSDGTVSESPRYHTDFI